MRKYTARIIISVLCVLVLQSYVYPQPKPLVLDLDKVRDLIESHIRQNKWEEARASLNYLQGLIKLHHRQDYFQVLEKLDYKVSTLVRLNLEQLYQKGLGQFNDSQFSSAVITFRKILYYGGLGYDKNQRIKQLLEQARILRNASITVHGKDVKQKTTVATSKVLDKRQTGLRVYKPGKCWNGYTLFSHPNPYASKTASLNPIYLIDMKGDIIYQWMTPYNPFLVRMDTRGNIIYTNCVELQRLDQESNILWHSENKGQIEHAFQILNDGSFLIARTEKINTSSGSQDINNPYISPYIEIITPDKEILWRWQGDEHIEELEKIIGLKIQAKGNWANINACSILDDNPLAKKDSRFRKGNILFSYDLLNTIGIIDYPTGEIVWAWGPGILCSQHAPTMLDNGNLLIFNNNAWSGGWSQIIKLNPLTEEIVWEYHAEPKEDFFSGVWSNAQKLPNGNIFVCEGVSNRLFEITPQGEIVWDFISTFGRTTGAEGIYRAYRYSSEYVKPLLDRIKK